MIDITSAIVKIRQQRKVVPYRQKRLDYLQLAPPISVLAIDPSIRHMGWAYFRRGILTQSGVVHTPRQEKDWLARLDNSLDQMRAIAHKCKPISKVILEMPSIWSARSPSLSSRSLVAENSSALLKLQAIVFSLREWFLTKSVPTFLFTPQQWKGQTPKAITKQRMTQIYGIPPDTNHNESDAIGLAHWYLRVYYTPPRPQSG